MQMRVRSNHLLSPVSGVQHKLLAVLSGLRKKRLALVACSIIALSGTAVAAYGALQDQSSTYTGCVNKGSGILRVIQPGETCRKNETQISWNQSGPAGPAGSIGPAGQQGQPGEKGDTGPAGPAGNVSLASLAGTACTRADGSTGAIGVNVGDTNEIELSCQAQASWCTTDTSVFIPHMTVSCDNQTHQPVYICDEGWLNTNNEINDGCEASTGGLQPLLIQDSATTRQALTYFSASGILFGGIDTITVSADCNGTFKAACPDGTASNPLPTMTADMNQKAGDMPRTTMVPDPNNSRYDVTARFRVKTNTPIIVTPVAGTQCTLSIDSTRGSSPDIIASFHDNIVAPNGPTTIHDVTLSGLEDADFSINPVNIGDIPCYGASIFPSANVLSVLENELTPWLTKRATLCGAVAPYYFQICSDN